MAGYYPVDRSEWLLQIGRRLRTEYDDIIAAAPLPERLVPCSSCLKRLPTIRVKQLETATNARSRSLPAGVGLSPRGP